MQFSQKSKEHIDSCRFCWMCHHICPIGNATGLERNTARARALGLSLVTREAIEYSDDIVANVYECSLCGGCVADCTTGWDPVMFAKEARLVAALEDKLPSYITKMIENLGAKGNIYGLDKNDDLTKLIASLKDSDTLLFLGEDATYKAPECAINAINLLKNNGVDFTVLANEPNSGFTMDFMVGAAEDTKDVMKECAKALSKFKTVVCYDGADAKVMKREYKEWGVELSANVVTFTEFIASLIKDGKLNVKNNGKEYTIQDSYLLARDLEETEPVREIISACGKVNEMLLNRKGTMLAGHLIMNEYMPKAIEEVAKNRWINAINMNAKVVVTANTAEYVMLKKTKPEGVEVKTIEEVVAECL